MSHFLATCQQTSAGETHFFAGGPTCVCGKRAAVVSTDDQERPTLRLIKGEKKDA